MVDIVEALRGEESLSDYEPSREDWAAMICKAREVSEFMSNWADEWRCNYGFELAHKELFAQIEELARALKATT